MTGPASDAPARPLPRPNADTAPFWAAAAQGRFLFQRCRDCGRPQFSPRSRCRHCQSTALDWEASAGRGRVHSFTLVERPPSEAFRAEVPYLLALVDLDEGVRFMAQLRNCSAAEAAIGLPVRVVFEALGPGIALPQVEPATAQPRP